jgi:hypothetical protein
MGFENIDHLVSVVREELEKSGHTFYSRSLRGDYTALVMFRSAEKSFVFVGFKNDPPEELGRTQCHLDIAESKAEVLSGKIGHSYIVWKNPAGVWRVSPSEDVFERVDEKE